jgi:hypothetical protein
MMIRIANPIEVPLVVANAREKANLLGLAFADTGNSWTISCAGVDVRIVEIIDLLTWVLGDRRIGGFGEERFVAASYLDN